jgi:hypothetical protein
VVADHLKGMSITAMPFKARKAVSAGFEYEVEADFDVS